MSSVGVFEKKNLKCFVRKENLSVRRKIFKVWRGKNVSVKFRVFGKKMKEKFRKKNQSVFFWMKILKVKDFAKFVFTSWALC